jgi:DNA polymerase-3 subunit alpha
MNRRVLESLVAAGACDALGPERGALFAAAGRVLEQAAALQRERTSGQSSLFGEGEGSGIQVVAPPLPATEPWSSRDRSAREKEVLGFYFSEHPLEHMRNDLQKVASQSIAEALALEDTAEVRVAGLVGEVKPITTRAGKRMAVVTLEDLSARVECTVFPDAYEASRATLVPEQLVVVSGRVEIQEERGVRLLVSDVWPWEEGRKLFGPTLHIEVPAEELTEPWLEAIDEVLSRHPGECDVYLYITRPNQFRTTPMRSRRYRVAPDRAVSEALSSRFPSLKVRWARGSP